MGEEFQFRRFGERRQAVRAPRLDRCKHGVVDAYEFHVSNDGKEWKKISEGEFGNIEANTAFPNGNVRKNVV